jgi:hypothetical protein
MFSHVMGACGGSGAVGGCDGGDGSDGGDDGGDGSDGGADGGRIGQRHVAVWVHVIW